LQLDGLQNHSNRELTTEAPGKTSLATRFSEPWPQQEACPRFLICWNSSCPLLFTLQSSWGAGAADTGVHGVLGTWHHRKASVIQAMGVGGSQDHTRKAETLETGTLTHSELALGQTPLLKVLVGIE
jgi:hypothetical protein